MSVHDDLLQCVRSARPSDPDAAAAEGIAVRTLARFAVLEAAPAPEPRSSRSRRLLRAAAIVAAVLLPLASIDSGRSPEEPTVAGDERRDAWLDSWHARVGRALGGDPLACERVLHGGLPARRALLVAAETRAAGHDVEASRTALDLLRAAGSLRMRSEALRVAQLAREPALCTAACRVLARDMGSTGAACLGDLLAAHPDSEVAAVEGLEYIAQRGRREAAMRGLLAGVRRGRSTAAAAAVRLGGSTHLARVLAALPERLFASDAPMDAADHDTLERVVAALREGSRTLRARAMRLAERGDTRALRLACSARLRGTVRVLSRELRQDDADRAEAAVDLLAQVATVPAWIALARSLSSPLAGRVRAHLQNAPPEADGALVACARRSLRDAPAAMHALAVRGSVARLADLARESRLAPAAIDALGLATAPEASAALTTLAAQPARSAQVLAVLTERWTGGHAAAGAALLDLARAGHERPVLRALARAGASGLTLLQAAARDPQLGPRARHVLLRLRDGPANPRVAGGAPRRPDPSRSI